MWVTTLSSMHLLCSGRTTPGIGEMPAKWTFISLSSHKTNIHLKKYLQRNLFHGLPLTINASVLFCSQLMWRCQVWCLF